MSDIKVAKVFIIDPIPLANVLEAMFDPYLKDITDDCFNNKQSTISNRIKKDWKEGEIYNSKIEAADIMGNNIPIRGVELIKAYIDMLLINNSAYLISNKYSITDAVSKYLKEEYNTTEKVYDLLESTLFDLRIDTLEFIGSNKWIIHILGTRHSDLIIEQCQDFRIMDWEEKMKNGEWKING